MTSFKSYREAFVWIWLPGDTKPVVAGKLSSEGGTLVFNYGQSYLVRENKIPIYEPELPLKQGFLPLLGGLKMPSCIRDAAPDAWGRRVLLNMKLGAKGRNIDTTDIDELTFLLESGSDRIGALDFQLSPEVYEPRSAQNVSLEELLASAERVEKGVSLNPELDQALNHGSAIGGARPKALIESDNKKYIAKFSSSTDTYSVVKGEFIAMRLAKKTGFNVAEVQLTSSSRKDVLLIERFDRVGSRRGWRRRHMVSALTLFGLDELMARYASYETLAELIRHRFKNSEETLRELFQRLSFNILVGNTDDHARNHAAFWDGQSLELTPAYDICPQPRSGGEASQAMLIYGGNRMSQIRSCLEAAHVFQLSMKDAKSLIDHQVEIIEKNWDVICDEAKLSQTDRKFFWRRQFLNPYAVQ